MLEIAHGGYLMDQLWIANRTYWRETETTLSKKEYKRLIREKKALKDSEPLPWDKLYAHFPFVRMQEALSAHFTCFGEEVKITCLPYSLWSKLDSDFRTEERQYNESHPVFAIIPAVRDEHNARIAVACVHLGLVLASGSRLPAPTQSIIYLAGHRQVTREIGPLEREALLNGKAIRIVDDRLSERIQKLVFLLETALPLTASPEIRFALQTLDRGALREVNEVEDAVLCAIATEELVMNLSTSNLTETFERRVGVIITADPRGVTRAEAAGRQLYSARSHFLHRQSRERPPDIYKALMLGRPVLVRAVLIVLNGIVRGLVSPALGPELHALLDNAAANSEVRRLLHEGLPDADLLA